MFYYGPSVKFVPLESTTAPMADAMMPTRPKASSPFDAKGRGGQDHGVPLSRGAAGGRRNAAAGGGVPERRAEARCRLTADATTVRGWEVTFRSRFIIAGLLVVLTFFVAPRAAQAQPPGLEGQVILMFELILNMVLDLVFSILRHPLLALAVVVIIVGGVILLRRGRRS